MEKRVFIALKTSPGLVRKIQSWQRTQGDQPVRWIKAANLHITVIPPWYCADTAEIIGLLEDEKRKTGPIDLRFNRITLGPDSLEPRLIWLEGRAPDRMIALKSSLEKLLRQKPDRKKLLLHITIAKFRSREIEKTDLKNLDERVDWTENASALVLMESHLSPHGSEYEILAEIPL